MNIDKLITRHFPYPTPNPGQAEAIRDAIIKFKSGSQHVIIEAPTGIGKSAISYTVHKVLKDLNPDFVTSVITSTRALQDQYTKEFPIENLTGKSNYSCTHKVGPYRSLDCRSQIVNKKCNPIKDCSYFRQRTVWTDLASFRMTNHSFMISACPMLCMEDENKADLIIIDESHELEQNITEHSKVNLSIDSLNLFPSFKVKVVNVINMIQRKSQKVFTLDESEISQVGEIYAGCISLKKTLDRKMKESISGLKRYIGAHEALCNLEDYLEILSTKDILWIVVEKKPSFFVNLKPIRASDVSYHALFRKSDKFLHMTSTICGADTYAKSLGISEYDFIQVKNPIPVENRKVYFKPVTKVSGDIDYSALAQGVDLISNIYPNDSGIIHTVSFKLANEILNRSKNKSRMKVLNDREEILDHLRTKNGIVLSPSLEKGFDAKDDLSRFQILAKVPYGYLGDEYIKYNADSNKDWYARNAILRLVQSSGRSIRGITDYADTYILDSNFNRLYNQNKQVFPDWYRDALEM